MATASPWDLHLEPVTQSLARFTAGGAAGRATLAANDGWQVQFRGSRKSVSVQIARPQSSAPLDDYELVILYGLEYDAPGTPANPLLFAKTLSIRDGFGWDEQTLREVVLEALGILAVVFRLTNADAFAFSETTEPRRVLPNVARPKVPGRRRR